MSGPFEMNQMCTHTLCTNTCRTFALQVSVYYSVFGCRTNGHTGAGHVQDVAARAFRACIGFTHVTVHVATICHNEAQCG